MHNTSVRKVVFIGRFTSKVVSMASLVFELQLCIPIAYNDLYVSELRRSQSLLLAH